MSSKDILEALTVALQFYLSPANISHDKHLSQLLLYQKQVPIATFLRFNQVKQICGSALSLDLIKEAAGNLSELILIEGDYLKLRKELRIEHVETWRNTADTNTVYIENIPDDSTHASLREVFDTFGPVTYISLPRFSESKVLKGFAFIQFEEESQAVSALTLNGQVPEGWEVPLKVMARSEWLSFRGKLTDIKTRIESLLSMRKRRKYTTNS